MESGDWDNEIDTQRKSTEEYKSIVSIVPHDFSLGNIQEFQFFYLKYREDIAYVGKPALPWNKDKH